MRDGRVAGVVAALSHRVLRRASLLRVADQTPSPLPPLFPSPQTKQAAMRGDLSGIGNGRRRKGKGKGRRRPSLKREFLGQRVVDPKQRRRRTSSTDDVEDNANDNANDDAKDANDGTDAKAPATRPAEAMPDHVRATTKREFMSRPATASGRNRSARRLRLPTTRKAAPPSNE